MKILVTGAAGFIGSTLAAALLRRSDSVCGVDNLNDYYDVRLKNARIARLKEYQQFEFVKLDIASRRSSAQLFGDHKFDAVVNLAAQAGVRYSMDNPHAYADANLIGFLNTCLDWLLRKIVRTSAIRG
jgi:UDP-glucuronate 4-epimerase